MSAIFSEKVKNLKVAGSVLALLIGAVFLQIWHGYAEFDEKVLKLAGAIKYADGAQGLRLANELLAKQKDNPSLYSYRAECYLLLDQESLAIADMNKAIQAQPNCPLSARFYLQRGEHLLSTGHFNYALDDFESGIRLDNTGWLGKTLQERRDQTLLKLKPTNSAT